MSDLARPNGPGSCLRSNPSVSSLSAGNPSRGVEDEKARVLEAELALDLAKIALIMNTYMRNMRDDRLTIFDVASIKGLARQFAVPERAAYLRMKSLDMLSYQQDAAQGIEARQGRGEDSVEDESPVGFADAPDQSPQPTAKAKSTEQESAA